MDIKSKFQAALDARKKQKAEEAIRSNYQGGSYPDIPYTALYTNKQRLFRFVGAPYIARELPTDSKRIHVAMILGDDDKRFRCIGPDTQLQKDWLLYRIMNKVLARHWDKNIPGKDGKMGGYVYDNAVKHPDIYARVAKNNNVNNSIEQGWRFNSYILFNVIDRENYQWHLDNKKYRVLSKRASESGDRVYFDPGVPDTVYQQIIDEIVAVDGNTNWEDYDIVIKKVSEKPWYKVYHAIDDVKKLDQNIKDLVVATGLSDVERSWEMNDFDKLFPITRYSRIKNKLGIFIQRVDSVFGTHYYDELCSLVEKEEQDADKKDTKEAQSVSTQTQTAQTPPLELAVQTPVQTVAQPAPQVATPQLRQTQPQQQVQSAPVEKTSSVKLPAGAIPMTPAIWDEIAKGSRLWNGTTFKGVVGMTLREKEMVVGIQENNQFVWSQDAGELLEGAESHFLTPMNIHVDPVSGTEFGEPTFPDDVPF